MRKGIYIVVDPSMETDLLYRRVHAALQYPIAALQLWDNFMGKSELQRKEMVHKLCGICHPRDVPVLINNRWEDMLDTPLDGVHFDQIPNQMDQIRLRIAKPFITGITCTNDLHTVEWASANQITYLSFCSMFPSATATSCELVKHNTVIQTRALFDGPIYLAGGIRPENMGELDALPYDGVAVVSGIMNNEQPEQRIQNYLKQLN